MYDWGRGIAVWACVAGILTVLIGVVMYDYDDTFWSELVAIDANWSFDTYPADDERCAYVLDECALALATSNSSLRVYLGEYQATGNDDPEYVAKAQLSLYMVMDSYDELDYQEVDLLGEVLPMLSYERDGREYREIYYREGRGNLVIHIEGDSQRLLDNNWHHMLKMLETIEVYPS